MEVPHFKAVALAGLCMSLPIKIWRLRRVRLRSAEPRRLRFCGLSCLCRFRGVFGTVEVPFGPLYLTCVGARVIVRVVVRAIEFSL